MTSDNERSVEANSLDTEVHNTVCETFATGSIVQAHTINGNLQLKTDAPNFPTPQQLPSAPISFTGRTDILDDLTATFDSVTNETNAVAISTLTGASGIGKTCLAVYWSHSNLSSFPDGQLFVDLRGFSPCGLPKSAGEAVRGFLTALSVDQANMPADFDTQTALYRSLIAGKRMLILLDNAATDDQVIPLLPGDSSCTVLITSRRTLMGLVTRHGARHLHLTSLTENEAYDLLTARLGSTRTAEDPKAINDLMAHCRGFPLALTIVAGRAQIIPKLQLSELAAELRDTTNSMDMFDDSSAIASLPTILSWSYRALDLEHQRIFVLLGIAPGPDITVPAAASLADLPLERAAFLLRTLCNSSLLERHAHGRYSMHDLIRCYAAREARSIPTTEFHINALRRFVDFYVHAAYAAALSLNPHREIIEIDLPAPEVHLPKFTKTSEASQWFSTEQACLEATQQTAIAHGWHRSVWQLAWILDTYYFRHGSQNERIAIWKAGLNSAEHLSPHRIGFANMYLGAAYAESGSYEKAISHLSSALKIAEARGDFLAQAKAHRLLAVTWGRRDIPQQAIEHAKQSLILHRKIGNSPGTAVALNAVGWNSARLGNYDCGRTYCEAALALNRFNRDLDGEADALDSLGYIEYCNGNHNEAITNYQKAIALFKNIGHRYSTADALDGLGYPYAALGETAAAKSAWQEALNLYQMQGRGDHAARISHKLDELE